MADTSNAAQAEYWNNAGGGPWVALQTLLDWQLAPLMRAALARLRPATGERIVDVGCGCGATSLELAAAVGSSGSVLGADISAPMLAVARRRAEEAGLAQARFEVADAQTFAFEPQAADAVFSRFGVMFFADPAAAFANLRAAVKPGGRLAFVCWRSPGENPWMTAPAAAALAQLPPQPTPPLPADPNAPGPFGLQDGARTKGLLESAGWSDVAVTPHDERIGSRNLDDAMTLAMSIGPLGSYLRANPEHREAAAGAVRDTLAAWNGPDGVLAPSATWIVTARNRG
jgi:SAM-dependent methyltransferase